MKKLAILASGEGTNAEHLVRYFRDRQTAEVVLIIASRQTAGVIQRAERLQVPVEVVTSAGFASGEALRLLQEHQVDWVILAGFLLQIPKELLNEYAERIVNIHPSLLPKFGGKGMYGMHVHRAVLEAGEKESGITIQYINEHYDEGAYILQKKCQVMPDDTPETLAARVHELEYLHYPQTIEKLLAELP